MASSTSSTRPMPRLTPVAAPKRASSVFQSQNALSKEYWNNLICVFTGLNPDESQPAGVTSICNRDYFNDQPSPPRTPILRTRSSKTSIASSRRSSFLRPSFSTRRSSRSLLRRMTTHSSGIDYEIQEEPVPEDSASPATSPIEPVLEERSASFFEDSILSTIPGAPATDEEMISLEHDGKTIWLPRHVLNQYSAPLTSQRPDSAGRLTISIPDRTTSKPIREISHNGNALTLVETASSQAPSEKSLASTSPSNSSHRSKTSISDSSINSPAADTPGSVYSSDGTSQTSLELHSPPASLAPPVNHSKKYSVADPRAAGVFDDPPPVQPRNPRRTSAKLPLPAFEDKSPPNDDELHIVPIDNPESKQRLSSQPPAPALPQRSRRRDHLPSKPAKKLASARSMGAMSLAVVNEQPLTSAPTGAVSASAAETVLYNLLLASPSLPDLFALASVNTGFHAVYTRFQLPLVRSALFNACRPAWELREACGEDARPNSSQAQRAKAYLTALRRDAETLAELKGALADSCASFLRPTTLAALRSEHSDAVDAALWRIAAFCALFSASPADTDAQTAWLRSPARSDAGRLASEALYDMLELWTCIGTLLSSTVLASESALERAHAAGVIPAAADHAVLEAWSDAARARGPSVALELAAVAASHDADVFLFAGQMGVVSSPDDALMATFLKDAVGRVYCEALARERASGGSEHEIASPTPRRERRGTVAELDVAAADKETEVEVDERHIHPALRRVPQFSGEEEEVDGFVTPRSVASLASSRYSTRCGTPV